ncbi:General secretion pathway protein GspM [Bordetella sputigena]|uniref:type II secretion system protein GspM n=1 Tax=Bordetella sputigena TaxID=1416810 RepID=UPI0039EEAAD7
MKARVRTLPRPTLPPALLARGQAARQHAASYWTRLSTRERRLVRALAGVIVAALLFTIALRPALRDIAQWQDELPRLRTQAAAIDALVQEAQALKREQGKRIAANDMEDALRASLARGGLGGTLQVDRLEDGKRWRIAFEGVSAAALFDWLAHAPAQLHLRLAQVKLARPRDSLGRPVPAHVSGSLQLRDGGAPDHGGRS